MSEMTPCTTSPTASSKAVVISQFPHCDQKVLHGPGECVYCDKHPEWQALRSAWGINFTGHTYDRAGQACPAEYARTIATINAWPGNRPKPAVPQWVDEAASNIISAVSCNPAWNATVADIIVEAAKNA
jgi:hypothetical protein